MTRSKWLALEEANELQREWAARHSGQRVSMEDHAQFHMRVRDTYDPQFDLIVEELVRFFEVLPAGPPR